MPLPISNQALNNVHGSVDTETVLYKNGFAVCTSILASLMKNTNTCLGFVSPELIT